MLTRDECGRLRAFEPRNAHEHALLAQLPEFYSPSPSRENLHSIAQRVLRSTEEENRSLGRAAVEGLCPTVAPFQSGAAVALALLAFAYVCSLAYSVAPTKS
jgi:hypothetical protein